MKKSLLITFCVSICIGIIGFNILPKLLSHKVTIHGIIAKQTKKDLISDADVIIKGVVKDVLPSKWSNPNKEKGNDVRNIVITEVSVDINEIYKGTPYDNKNVTVRIGGGKVDNTEVISEGFPKFTVGENVILFLSKDDGDLMRSYEDCYVLTGMLQGKFTTKEETGTDIIYSNQNNEDKIKLSTFKDEIKQELENIKNNPKKKMTREEIHKQNEKVLGK